MAGTTEPPITGKTFCYDLDGLKFTITAFERDGTIFAKVVVTEGKMDVNALYWGDHDMSGKSASLPGPLNMNGAGKDMQWDGVSKISDPGLGKMGMTKVSYLQAGTSQNAGVWELAGVRSLDDLDVLGVRATSTTTREGSIKAIAQCDDHDDHEDGDDGKDAPPAKDAPAELHPHIAATVQPEDSAPADSNGQDGSDEAPADEPTENEDAAFYESLTISLDCNDEDLVIPEEPEEEALSLY